MIHCIDALQEHHAHVGHARRVGAGECHRLGIVGLVRLGFGEPGLEQREWLAGRGEIAGLWPHVVFALRLV